MKTFHKTPTVSLIISILLGSSNLVFAQFTGGNDDGSSYNPLIQSACAPLASTNIYGGGNDDGSSYNPLTQSACPVLPNVNIYLGNSDDGFSAPVLTQKSCVPLPSTNVYGGGSYDGFSGLSICFGCLSASCVVGLPIELLSFTAKLVENKYVLTEWITATEINNDYFTVEKTKDDRQYKYVGKVKGAGNSKSTLHYELIDSSPYQGISYYRLKQTDFDGKYTYSQLVPVNLKGVDIISISPNPAHDEFEYKIGSTEKMTVQVKVVDVLGQIVSNTTEVVEKGITQRSMNVSALSSGTYILELITEHSELRGKQFQIK